MVRKKLVVIGGGFAGSLLTKKLESNFDTTLIDKKGYFEFTPGILRSIVDPTHLSKIQVKHSSSHPKTKIIKAIVKKFDKKFVYLKNKKIPYDYLVIASGTKYSSPIKSSKLIVTNNAKILHDSYEKLCRAKRVCIVGGGLVGVELAAEIGTKYKKEILESKKEVTLIQSKDRLMPRQSKKSQIYSEKFLKKYGIKIIYNKRVTKEELDNRKDSPDLVFMCTGVKPNSEFIDKKYLDEKGYVKVKNNFLIEGEKNIFAAGDITNIKEEKLAQNAEIHAKIIVKNLLKLENKEKLINYLPKDRLVVASLGKYNGFLIYKNFTLTGIIPGLLKNLIEKMIVHEFK